MRPRLPVLALALGLVAAGCGSTAPAAPAANAPASTAAGAPKAPTPITIAVTVNSVAVAPLFVAQAEGFFARNGLEPKLVYMDGGAPGVQAVEGGSVQFTCITSPTVFNAAEKGVGVLSVETMINRVTMSLVLRKEVARRLNVSRADTLDRRLKSLKGLTLGITSPGTATDFITHYYLDLAGLQPSAVKIVSIGAGPALAAALKNGQIDGFQLTSPTPEETVAQGYGTLLVSASQGDVPGLSPFAYEMLVTTKEYAAAHADVVKAAAAAVAEGNDFILDHHAQAIADLKKHFDKYEASIVEASMASTTPAIPRDGRTDEAAWENAAKVLRQTGQLKSEVPTSEGVMWTNRFLPGS